MDGSGMRLRFCLLQRKLPLVGGEDRLFKLIAGGGGDGMGDVAEDTVDFFAAGHSDEKPFRTFDDLNVMDGQLIVHRDRHDRAQTAFLQQSSDFDIGDIHDAFLLAPSLDKAVGLIHKLAAFFQKAVNLL